MQPPVKIWRRTIRLIHSHLITVTLQTIKWNILLILLSSPPHHPPFLNPSNPAPYRPPTDPAARTSILDTVQRQQKLPSDFCIVHVEETCLPVCSISREFFGKTDVICEMLDENRSQVLSSRDHQPAKIGQLTVVPQSLC